MSLDARHAKRGKGSHTNKCYIDSKIISYLIQTKIVKRIRLRIPIIIAPISLYQEYEYLCETGCARRYTLATLQIYFNYNTEKWRYFVYQLLYIYIPTIF